MPLRKELGILEVFSIAAGAMISSGLFVLPGIAFAKAGPAMILSYIIAGLLVVPALLSKAELVTAMPKAGGDYFYITRSMGFAPGTVAGLASWLSLSLKTAFALMGMGIFALLINPGLSTIEIKAIAVILCLFFMVINLLGVKEAGITQILLVAALFVILGLYVIIGFTNVHPQRLDNFTPYGFGHVLSTAGLVFISFGGLTKVASVAEEIKNPKITVPLGMMLAYTMVLGLYVAVAFVTVGILEPETLRNSLTPISTGAKTFWGIGGIIVTAIAALLAFISTANAGIMSASRYPLAMSRDEILPHFFSRISRKFKTPHIAIIVTSLIMIITILFLDLEVLVKVASTMLLLLYISANLAVIVMRESRLQNYQPSFKAPLYPYIQIAGILGYLFLIVDMGVFTLTTTAVFILAALIWYLFYVRPKITRESALMCIVERVTDRQIATDSLREELREVVKEREEIIEDEFDHLIKDAIILDFEKSLHFDEFVQIASEKLSKRLGVEKLRFVQLFIEREKQSCTALRPGLAIPHIIIDGSDKFDVLLVRARDGIIFPDAPEPVHIIFVLVGTQDRRRSHLRALMAIAQISQDPDFDRTWQKAGKPEDLRDIVLLGKRKRH
ncbi:MAG: amino acid permease [candidate division WOR-3 bacterium]|nr:MAG: amino acid permease [candidate division WOR-3 bacterium]